MSVFTFAELQGEALTKGTFGSVLISKSAQINESKDNASSILNFKKDPDSKQYDIFLSHSFNDRVAVLGLKLKFEQMGFPTYVDWCCDPQLSRSSISKATSEQLRMRMKNCKTLIYAFSSNAANSSWMPWELGFIDGDKSRCSVLRVEDENQAFTYKGYEYLEIYPYVQEAKPKGKPDETLWVYEKPRRYVIYSNWIKGANPTSR